MRLMKVGAKHDDLFVLIHKMKSQVRIYRKQEISNMRFTK